MSLSPILTEPEVISSSFLLANLLGAGLIRLFLHAWPLSLFWTLIYATLVYIITRRLAAGRSYIATKNLRGQTVIVTGAATGIGRVTALELAKLGAHVIVGVRGQERAERLANDLSKESNGGTVIGHDLDLSSLANVKAFADKIDRVDILINNAGMITGSYSETADGIEKQFGTNHIGHFYLTKLLLPLLKQGRVVNVSSLGHYMAPSTGIDYSFAQLKKSYSSMRAYSISKLAQIWHASELTRRHGIKAYSLHPGTIVNTSLQRNRPQIGQVIIQAFNVVAKTVEQGAMTTLYCALSDDAQSGRYHSNCRVVQPSSLALDKRRAEECWTESEKLINEKIRPSFSLF